MECDPVSVLSKWVINRKNMKTKLHSNMVLTGFAREIHADLQSLILEHPDSKINEREKWIRNRE